MTRRDFPVARQFGHAARLVWASSRRYTLLSIIAVALQAVLSVAALVLLKSVVDAVITHAAGSTPEGSFWPLAVLVAAASLVALLLALLGSGDAAISEMHADLVRDYMHGLVHAKAVRVDLAYYDNTEYFNTLHRVQVEAPDRATNILASVLQVARSSVTLLAIAGLLFVFQWWVAAVLVLGDLPGAIVRLRSAWLQYRWERDSTTANRRARYFSGLLSARYVAQELRLFGLGELFADRYRQIRERLRQERRRLIRRRVSADAAAQTGAAIAMFVAYAFIAGQALKGAITIGDVAMYFAAFQRGRGLFREMLFGVARFYENSLFLAEFSQFLALGERVSDPPDPVPVPVPLRSGVAFDGVSFRYPGARQPALEDVSLTVRPGECIAVVGPSGSGKTTLVKLLCRMYDPTSGRITADDIELPRFLKRDWTGRISAYFQESGKYFLAAHDNIGFGDLSKMDDRSSIADAARRSGADEIIRRLERGYDTVLGTVLEQGRELSMGEWQKVALARTYLRDAGILILDEPTNAMDAVSEQRALEPVWERATDRITVLISHRLSTLRRADRVYMLSGGRIVESGTHEELLRMGTRYAEMFGAQARSES